MRENDPFNGIAGVMQGIASSDIEIVFADFKRLSGES
jgi:hypothetical protein